MKAKKNIYLIILVIQWLLIFFITHIYHMLFGTPRHAVGMATLLNYYLLLLLPLVVVLWNFGYWKIESTLLRYTTYAILIGMVVIYWKEVIQLYPLRMLFTILTTVSILVGGNCVLQSLEKQEKYDTDEEDIEKE